MPRRTRAARPVLSFLPLEDRVVPTVTVLLPDSNTFIVESNAANDEIRIGGILNPGAQIYIEGTGLPTGSVNMFKTFIVRDTTPGGGGNQKLTFEDRNGLQINITGSITITGIESVTVNNPAFPVAAAGGISVSGATAVARTGTSAVDFQTTGTLALQAQKGLGSAANPLRLSAQSTAANTLKLDTGGGNGDQYVNAVTQLRADPGNVTAGTGTVFLTGGTLFCADANVLGANTGLDLAAGTTFDVFNGQTVARLTGSGTVTSTGTKALEVITVGSAADSTFAGKILNGASKIAIVKQGTGSFTLSNPASDFSGDVTVTGGKLVAAGGNNLKNAVVGALGNAAVVRTITVNTGAVLAFGANDVFGNAVSTPAAAFVVAGGTVTTVGNFFNTLGPVTLNGGTLTSVGGDSGGYQAYQLTGPVAVGGSAASAISGTGTFAGVHLADTAFTVADATGNADPDLIVSVPLLDRNISTPGAAGATFAGAGTTAVSGAGGNNFYSGTTVVGGGVVAFGGGFGGDGAVRGDITVNSGGTFRLLQNDIIINSSAVQVNTGGTFDMNKFVDVVGTLGGGGAVTNTTAAGLALDNFATLGNFFGVMSGAGGLLLRGSIASGGTQIVDGKNTYTGVTQIDKGTLQVGDTLNGTLGTGPVTNNGTLVIKRSDAAEFANLLGGAGAIAVAGTGTLTVSNAANTATGTTTITGGGTLLVDGKLADVVVAGANGVLGGKGTVAAVTVQAGGNLLPGSTTTFGTLNTGSVTFAAGAFFGVKINGATAGAFDALSVTGTVTLGGANIFELTATPGRLPRGTAFTVIANDGTDKVVGTFLDANTTLNLAEGGTFLASSGETFRISYVGGDGNDVTLTNLTNSAPTAAVDAAATALNTAVTIDVLANDTDVDGDALTLTAVGTAASGTVAIVGGKVVYTPNAGFAGSNKFTYTVSDALGGTSTGAVEVTVAGPVNAPPVANPDAASTLAGTAVTLNVVANDTDSDGGVLSVTALGAVTNGTAVIAGAKSVTFTPASGFTGATSFTYTLSDAQGGTATGTVTVTVNAADPTRLIGFKEFGVGTDLGTTGRATLFNPDGSTRYTVTPFESSFTGGVRTAAADFNGDGVADLIVGTGPGRATRVRILSGTNQAELFSVDSFESAFTGGVYVTAGDLNGDGTPDLVITPDEGGGPRVDAYSGKGFGKFLSFFGIDDVNFRGGARASTGDLNGDGRADLIVVAGFGGGPRVAGFNGTSLAGTPSRIFGDFFAFEQSLRNGIFVTVGDLDGDGFADLICGGGPGGGPRVLAFGGSELRTNGQNILANFFGGDVNSRGGIRLGVKNLDNDTRADLVVGAGAGAGSRVTTYFGKNIGVAGTPPTALDFDAFVGFTGGVFVG